MLLTTIEVRPFKQATKKLVWYAGRWGIEVSHRTLQPEKLPTSHEAVHLVGSPGGHQGRTGDGEPGTKSRWPGLQQLDDIKSMWKITMQPPVSKNKSFTGVQNPRYG